MRYVRSPASLFVDSTFRPSFFVTCPLTNPRMLWFCQSVAFAISASVAPSFRLISSRTFWALLRDRVPFGLVVFAAFFALTGFTAFEDFLVAFVFFAVVVSVVVSLIVILLCVECIGRHIHHSGSNGRRGERPEVSLSEEGTG